MGESERWYLGPAVGSETAYLFADSAAAAPDLVRGAWCEYGPEDGWQPSQVRPPPALKGRQGNGHRRRRRHRHRHHYYIC